MKSTDLPDILGNQGFTREYSNVYIYTENDTYYGEIIIQPEVSSREAVVLIARLIVY